MLLRQTCLFTPSNKLIPNPFLTHLSKVIWSQKPRAINPILRSGDAMQRVK